jgi:hypothetical protein
MSSLVGKQLTKFREEQHRIIFQERNQPRAMKALADMVKNKKNDFDIVGQIRNYFKAQSERQNLSDDERTLAKIYSNNLDKIYNQMTFKIEDAEKFPEALTQEEEIEAVIEPAPPAQQPPAFLGTGKPKKGKKAKKGEARALEEAFANLQSDAPDAYRVFLDTLALAPEKTRTVTKKDLLALKPILGFIGNSNTKTSQLIEIIKESIGQYANENKLEQVRKDWEATQTKGIKEEIARKGEAGEKLTPEEEEIETERVEQELMGEGEFDIDKFILEKFKKNKNEQIAEQFLQHNPATDTVAFRKLDFTPKRIKRTGYSSVQDALIKSITELAYLNQYDEQFKKVKDTEEFRQKTTQARQQYLNDRIRHEVTKEGIDEIVKNNPFYTAFFNYVTRSSKSTVDLHDINEAVRGLKNVPEAGLLIIKDEMEKFNKSVIKDASDFFAEAETIINSPADISKLPPKVKPSMVKPEDILTPLDRYNKQKAELLKKMKDEDYEKLKTKKNMGTATAEEQDKLKDIEQSQEALKKLEPEAKKEQAKKSSDISKRTTATQRSGKVRPHFLNPTQKAVEDAIGETVEEQIKDIKNWYIFDLPEYSTGVGNKYENPLVKQNEQRDMMLVDRTDIFSGQTTYLLSEGVEERKDFYMSSRPALTKGSIGRGLFEVEVDETEEQFLQRFNEGSNGLFSQDQTKMEVSDFKNIYQTPPDHIINDNKNTGEKHEFEFTNNRGIKHTDKIWLGNINLFYDNAPILP